MVERDEWLLTIFPLITQIEHIIKFSHKNQPDNSHRTVNITINLKFLKIFDIIMTYILKKQWKYIFKKYLIETIVYLKNVLLNFC